jgi:hypothetical protein
MARGRDATDVAIVTSFGPCTLASFKVITQEVTSAVSASPRRIVAFALGLGADLFTCRLGAFPR